MLVLILISLLFLQLNLREFKRRKDYFNPFHIASFSLFFYGLGPLVNHLFFEPDFDNSIIENYINIWLISLLSLYAGFQFNLRVKDLNLGFTFNRSSLFFLLILVCTILMIGYRPIMDYFMVKNGGYENVFDRVSSRTEFSGLGAYITEIFIYLLELVIIISVRNNYLKIFLVVFVASFSLAAGGRVLMINSILMLFYVYREIIFKIKPIGIILIFVMLFFSAGYFNLVRGKGLSFSQQVELIKFVYDDSGFSAFLMNGEFLNPGTSTLNILNAIDDGALNFKLGSTYFIDLLSFFPRFILQRQDPIIDQYHLFFYKTEFINGHGKGFFILTEAYWNFGLIGVIIEFIIIGITLKYLYLLFGKSKYFFTRHAYYLAFFSLNFVIMRNSFFVSIKYLMMYCLIFYFIDIVSSKRNTFSGIQQKGANE